MTVDFWVNMWCACRYIIEGKVFWTLFLCKSARQSKSKRKGNICNALIEFKNRLVDDFITAGTNKTRKSNQPLFLTNMV